jgi:hypothetical protein
MRIRRSSSSLWIRKSQSDLLVALEEGERRAEPRIVSGYYRMKRLQQAKALKQKANKQLEALGRRHLRDVRIVRKDMVYVTGMKMGSGDKEEVSSGQVPDVMLGEA